MEVGSAPPLAGKREWWGLVVLALPTMLTMLDISVLFLALPQLTADLGASSSQQLWISDIYGFLIAGFLVTMGNLGDRIGRRNVLVGGAVVFTVVSVVAAWSTSPEMLIICRALLGIAGATIMPSTLALIMGMFPHPKQMGAAIGVWATAMTAGVALGPVVGGILLQAFWWGSVFLIAVPIMLLVVVAGPALLPAGKHPMGPGKIDLVSVVLSLLALLPFIYGFKEIARSGWDAVPVLSVVLGVVFGVVFVLRQRKLEFPLLDLSLFGIKAVSGALVLSLLVAGIQGGTGFFVVQFLQAVKGLSPLATGLWVLLPTLLLIVGIFMSQGLATKIRPGHIMAVSMLIAAVGMVVLSTLDATSALAWILVGFGIVYLGVSPIGPLVGRLVVPAAPPEKAGSASGLQSTSGELGVALGIALMGSIGMAVYRGAVDVPAEIAGTPAGDAAGETLAGALIAAQNLTGDVATGLVASAKEAFASGLNTVAVVGIVVFVGLSALALATLKQIPPMAPPPAPPAEGDAPAGAEEQAAAAPAS